MKRLLSFYHPLMPVYLARHLRETSYNPETFIDWYITFPDIREKYGQYDKSLSILQKSLVGFSYYFWVFYVLSALFIIFLNPVIGVVAFLLSPFIIGGVWYALVYALWIVKYRKLSQKSLKKKTKSHKTRATRRRKR